ncbi:MAG: hypothetical protein GWN00_00615 [Aliifodinibius sp.]|nr:hypothetical protein [Fodinibius sp.]NIW96691.1 hypothetical protein [Phycisphaerae bacterium]NIY23367.1 hypothetical protein [Fodinibius sp.]
MNQSLPEDYVDFAISTLTGHFSLSFKCGRCLENIHATGLCLNVATMTCYMGDTMVGYESGRYICPVCMAN